MDLSTLTARVWILLLRWALHITVAPEAVDAITAAARAERVPEERLFALCFVESTLGQGPRRGLLCGYQGRISAREREAWPFGGEVARSNVRWQATHAAHAFARWHERVCTRGSDAARWDGAAAFYNTGVSCAPRGSHAASSGPSSGATRSSPTRARLARAAWSASKRPPAGTETVTA